MMDWSWISTSGSTVLMVILKAVGVYVALIVLTRIIGLRSFSKISGFDFAITVSFGSVLASVLLSEQPSLMHAVSALAALFAIQLVVSVLRRYSFISAIVDNQPLLLMAGDSMLHDNLKRAHITVQDLQAKLREANVTHTRQIRAVVMESTGDVSVLHAAPDAPELDLTLLTDVRGVEYLADH